MGLLMKKDKSLSIVVEAAKSEIEDYGLPTLLHFNLSLEQGANIAHKLGADTILVQYGTALMDLKLGEAFKEKRLSEHVKMSSDAAAPLLDRTELNTAEKGIIQNSILAHHGTIPFESLEAEIVANADCYRFIHPKGVLHYISTLGKRDLDFDSILNQAEAKLDEKWKILSLEFCINELEEHYKVFKNLFSMARKNNIDNI